MEESREIQLNKPDPFKPRKNDTSGDWRIWKQNFLIYLELTEARQKLSERGLALFLLNLMGPVGIEAKENITFDDPSEEENMEILLKKFDEVFDPPLNEMEQRYKFFSRRKCDTESVENFVTCLKELASTCNFGKQVEKFILDMVVLNMDSYLQQQVFPTKDLSLDLAIKMFEEDIIKEEKLRNIYTTKFDRSFLTDYLTGIKSENDTFSQTKQKEKAEITKNIKENASKDNLNQHRVKLCGTCFEIGHDTEDCNKVIICGKCSKKGHYSEKCNEIIFCGKCSKEGHYSEECNEIILCGICSGKGHYSEECNNKIKKNVDRQTSGRSTGNYQNQASAMSFCSKCRTHHKLNECPAEKKQNSTNRTCFRCNRHHPPKQCPAYNVTCFKCHKVGHFDYACKSKDTEDSFLRCDRCNKVLFAHDEYYNCCRHCNILVAINDDSDSDESENTQPRRRRRRQRRNKQPKNEESCCIS